MDEKDEKDELELLQDRLQNVNNSNKVDRESGNVKNFDDEDETGDETKKKCGYGCPCLII